MIVAVDLELRAGSRTLVAQEVLQVQAGERVGLVGPNGAGKTTLMRVLAGAADPFRGSIRATGAVDYLSQEPRDSEAETTGRDRILSARGLDTLLRQLEKARLEMGEHAEDDALARSIERYSELEEQFTVLGGYAADAEAAEICAALRLPERVLRQRLGTLSGGQRRRVELARILFAAGEHRAGESHTLLLDEPTNHLDSDSVEWLQTFLCRFDGAVVLVSHDTTLLAGVVNRVWALEPGTATVQTFTGSWESFTTARANAQQRRSRERVSAEKSAAKMRSQAARMGANANRATAAKQLARRADDLLEAAAQSPTPAKAARIRFPTPAPSGRTILRGTDLTKGYGELSVLDGVDLAIDRGSRVVVLGLNGAGKTTLLRLLVGDETPDRGHVSHGTGLRMGYFAQQHDTLDFEDSVWTNAVRASPDVPDRDLRTVLGTFLLSGDQLDQPVGTLSGGERTRLTLATLVGGRANLLLLDEPTNNLDPQSREQVLLALRSYEGAVVLVSHDRDAVEALRPDRVIVLPDATEDYFSEDYLDLVSLA